MLTLATGATPTCDTSGDAKRVYAGAMATPGLLTRTSDLRTLENGVSIAFEYVDTCLNKIIFCLIFWNQIEWNSKIFLFSLKAP